MQVHQYKMSNWVCQVGSRQFAQSCSSKNLTCPPGSTCMCAPCKAVIPQPIIAYDSYTFAPSGAESASKFFDKQLQASNVNTTACQRMEVCATFAVGTDAYLMVGIQPSFTFYICNHVVHTKGRSLGPCIIIVFDCPQPIYISPIKWDFIYLCIWVSHHFHFMHYTNQIMLCPWSL